MEEQVIDLAPFKKMFKVHNRRSHKSVIKKNHCIYFHIPIKIQKKINKAVAIIKINKCNRNMVKRLLKQ